jgi:mono/diheme cytochrome c family protein
MQEVKPINQANKESDIPWPLNARWPLAIWNFFFLEEARYENKNAQSVEWNRGAYLTQSLGHCGACHTPRGIAFQEKGLDESDKRYLSGGVLDGWSATNLADDFNTGLKRWSESEIAIFLMYGSNQHSATFGTMTEVINNSTQHMTAADLMAMAKYLKSLPSTGDKGQSAYRYDSKATLTSLDNPTQNSGARLYGQYCIACHGADGKGVAPYLSPLAGNPAVLDPDPSSLINVILNGTPQRRTQGITAAYHMPKFRDNLNDEEVASLVSFMQQGWNHNLAITKSAQVSKVRKLDPIE